jgi:hypothetical protein
MDTSVGMPLNDAQLEVLQLLASGLSDSEMAQLRQMIVSFKFRLVEERAQKAAEAKGLTMTQINSFPAQHYRKTRKKL